MALSIIDRAWNRASKRGLENALASVRMEGLEINRRRLSLLT